MVSGVALTGVQTIISLFMLTGHMAISTPDSGEARTCLQYLIGCRSGHYPETTRYLPSYVHGGSDAMTKTTRRKSRSDEEDNSISEEEAVLAARHAFTFLVACAQGEVEGITTGERIFAARAVLEHTARVPRLLNTILDTAGMLSGDDVDAIAVALG